MEKGRSILKEIKEVQPEVMVEDDAVAVLQ